jgi:hypothetical protein
MAVPEEFDLFLGGGRGGAKSHALALLALRRAEGRPGARVLYVRRSYKGLADFEGITRSLFGAVYGPAARYNAAEHVWRLPGGAYFELGQLEGPGDYNKYQGRSFDLLLVDEAGQYADPSHLDVLRSNLRGPKGVPVRTVVAANPGGVGHHWLAERYVFKGAAPWEPFEEPCSGRRWVYAPSTFRDNPFIDQAEYEAQLRASCPDDPELLRAWLVGDWSVARGAFFAGVLSESRNCVDVAAPGPDWRKFLSHDWGSSAPSVTYVVARSPGAALGGVHYPRDSLLVLGEVATNRPNRLDEGLGYTVPRVAEEVKAMCAEWRCPPRGAADDAIFALARGRASLSIADEFAHCGVRLRPARKATRAAGWSRMRTLLRQAGEAGAPGLFIGRGCSYFWRTVPYLPRDPRDPEDLDSTAPDHAADAVRYACVYRPQVVRFGTTVGT